ncbi:MAG: class I SAM-dependent methyltransferase [Rickettsiaceae bacterium]
MPIDSDIRNAIAENGYIKVDEMMRRVLSMSSQSYYRSVKNIGSSGDFITSPEISQLFGEMVALWALEQWQKLGSPSQFSLIELGPGQGKLMGDLLRASKVLPQFLEAAKIFLFEINPHFIKKQQQNLEQFGKDIKWIESFDSLPQLPTIIIANEFFDALPIKQFIKIKDTWFESVLITDPVDGQIKYDRIEVHKNLQMQLKADHKQAKDGAVIEESVESLEITRVLSKYIFDYRGAALIIDYGYNIAAENRTRGQYNPTLQAIKNHQYWPIIDTLGEADLTAHVDFNALIKASHEQGISSFSYFSQREFLLKYGIELRGNMLKQNLLQHEKEIIDRQISRLTSEKGMGELFKVLELSQS